MVVVNPRVDSGVPLDLLNELRQIAPATIGHMLEHEFMEPELRPIISRFAFAGPALTVRCFGTDSAIVHRAGSRRCRGSRGWHADRSRGDSRAWVSSIWARHFGFDNTLTWIDR